MPRHLRDLLRELTGSDPGDDAFWERLLLTPPDVFAVTSTILAESGAYRLAVSPPSGSWPVCHERGAWNEGILRLARAWRKALDAPTALPTELGVPIARLRAALGLHVRRLGDIAAIESDAILRAACLAVFQLHALADESYADVLSVGVKDGNVYESITRLSSYGTLSTFDTERVRVLPKLRTPSAGITLRSLSHYLSAHHSEIDVTWMRHLGEDLQLVVSAEERLMNLLLIPWPFEIHARQFKSTDPVWREPTEALAFAFSPPSRPDEVAEHVTRAIQTCRKRDADVHGVVLPELALDQAELAAVKEVLVRENVGLVLAGVRDGRHNFAHLALHVQKKWLPHDQHKHHRWRLDGEQIHQYHLAGGLHPGRRYWEDIDIPERRLRFVSLSDWITLCHLICEDLARLDPVSDVIRSVGPNLVIALLLDGPQIEPRWPGRYASVLADDPGTSVLTLSSLGMVQRCLPRGRSPSRVVGLWKDSLRGAQELVLDSKAHAMLISICGFRDTSITADGRKRPGNPGQLVLSAIEQVAY